MIVHLSEIHASTKSDLPKPDLGVYSCGGKSKKNMQFAQFEFDVKNLRDPAGQQQFKGKSGLDKPVQDWVKEDPRVQTIINDCLLLADDLVRPKLTMTGTQTQTAKASQWLSFSFRDHHGKLLAPAVAELVAHALSDAGYNVAIFHREMPKPQSESETTSSSPTRLTQKVM